MRIYILALLLITSNIADAQSLCLGKGEDHGIDYKAEEVNKYMNLQQYRAIFFGEQHNGSFDPEIKYHLITGLNKHYGTRHFFMEIGRSCAWRFNKYLQTGDGAYINNPALVYRSKGYGAFWKRLYEYNSTLPADKKLVIHGIDFERSEVFETLMMLAPENEPVPASIQTVMDTIKAHVADKPMCMYNIVDGKMIEYDNTGFIATLDYVRDVLWNERSEVKKYYGANYKTVREIITNNAIPVTKAKPRDKTMHEAIKDAVEGKEIDRFVVFAGKEHTVYTSSSALPNMARGIKGMNSKDILNITEIVYNVRTNDEKAVHHISVPATITTMNADCKATILPGHAVPGYKNKADFVIIADAE